ncbi:MerR family transcriptional regulator [Plantactinospora siamensis]|uniref:MerR family transcriptional regulator n=1 Tax=Plantactinospora siamensis TaxID=555372 RepID=A0ABV6NVW5_9ACTN
MAWTVGRVAEAAGVSVRTLHHYDEIGLLRPGSRTSGGYRRYDDADLDRLQQILFYRELGFPLEEIAAILDDPDADPVSHLRRQHELLTGRVKRLQQMVQAIEFAMEARSMNIRLTPEERFEVFGEADPDRHAAEAERRWGDTDAYRESARRAARYTKDDWLRIKAEQEDWNRRFVAVMDSGAAPDGPAARELAEEHRQLISRSFYECGYDMHRGLADMYMADPRFTQTYETIRPGMAGYLRTAIHANADSHG